MGSKKIGYQEERGHQWSLDIQINCFSEDLWRFQIKFCWRFKRTFNSICPQFCSCSRAKSFGCLALIFLLPNQCLPATSASSNRCHFLRLHQVRCIKQKWSKNNKSGPKNGRPLLKICDPSASDHLPWLSFRRCPRRDLNPRPLPYQGSALPLSYKGLWKGGTFKNHLKALQNSSSERRS